MSSDLTPDRKSPFRAEKASKYALTLLFIALAIGFSTFLVLKALLIFEGQLGRQSTQVAIALTLAFVLAPISCLILLLRHPRAGDPLGVLMAHPQGILFALLVLVLGLGLSALAGWSAERQAQDVDQTRFERLSASLHQEIFNRLNLFNYGLRASRGLWPAKTRVNREEFNAMLQSRELEKEFVGVVSVGFIEKVDRKDLEAFLKTTRLDGEPNFQVTPTGDNDQLYITKFIYPVKSSAHEALGQDNWLDQRIRTVAETSALTGDSMMTLPLGNWANPEKQGVLYLLPVYRRGTKPTDPQSRAKALQGWIFMDILSAVALKGAGKAANDELDFEVFEGTRPSIDQLVYDDDDHLRTPLALGNPIKDEELGWQDSRSFHISASVNIGGQTWTIATSARPTFVRASRAGVWQLAGGGALLSLLGSCLVFTLTGTTRRAKAIAEQATASLRAQTKLHEQMALVVQKTKNLVIITDGLRRIEWVNPAFEQLTGYSLAEVKGKVPGSFLQSPKADAESVRIMAEAVRSGQGCRVEILNRGKKGNEYWVDIEVQPIASDPVTGRTTGFIAVQTDITDRKRAEEGMREAVERSNLALASAEMGAWDWNVETGQVIYDRRWAEILGLDPERLALRVEEWSNRVHPDDLERATSELNRHFRGETPFYRCLHRMRHRDGAWRWILDNGKVVSRDSTGKPLRMVGTQMDVTEERRTQDELALREKALTTTSRLAKVGWWEINAITMTPVWSDQVRAIHEVGPDFVVDNLSVGDFYPLDALAIISECIRHAIQQAQSFDVELPFRTAKHRSLWVRVLGEPVLENGEVVKVVGALQDITDLVAAREKADAASRAKTDFLANMSHEIRTPMTAILGYTELLYEEANRDKAPRQRVESIETIRRNGEHLLTIINDILDVSKIEAGKMSVESIPTDPVQVVEDVVSLMQVRSKIKGILLERVYETALPRTFPCDPLRLKQILVNLVGNAVKFTEMGKVTIRVALERTDGSAARKRFLADQNTPQEKAVSQEIHSLSVKKSSAGKLNGMIRFEVADTGVGMTKEQADRLFRPFTQADETMSRKFGGTGLGLTIAKRLAELLGGDISVQTEKGKGSILTARVATGVVDATQLWKPDIRPGDDFGQNQALNPPPLPQGAGLSQNELAGVRILLAEDGIDNQRLLTFHLKKAGALVILADDGVKAVKELTTLGDLDSPVAVPSKVDLILMDMQMPAMDGYSATRALRRLGCPIPIIGLTAHAMSGDREKCLQAGCDDYETKPINRARLIQICKEWASRKRTQEENGSFDGAVGLA